VKKPDQLQSLLDHEVERRNDRDELSYEKPDPLLIASRYRDESIALICALFGYGNARQIVKFLDTLDFSLLECSEEEIVKGLQGYYYRFQKSEDVAALFIALKRLRERGSLENIFDEGYRIEGNILDGLWRLIKELSGAYPHRTQGYRFLIGTVPKSITSAGTYKRYMMFLRWMVRKDSLDMGLWKRVNRRDLIMPLDTHTFHVSRRLGLIGRKRCDMKAALELTERLRLFDPEDPVKYDFALLYLYG